MRFLDLLFLSTRMFKTRTLRTLLTVLGVSVGIGTVLFLVSLGYGLQNSILDRITTADSLLSLDVSPASAIVSLDREKIENIAAIPEIEIISPIADFSSQFTIDNITGDGMIYAVEPSFFRLEGLNINQGKFFADNTEKNVILSSAAAKLFNQEEATVIGRDIKLRLFIPNEDETELFVSDREDSYQVVGIINDENSAYAYVPAGTLADLNINSFSRLKVKVRSNEAMEKVRTEVIDLGFSVSSLSDTIDQANKIFRVIQIILAVFGLIALIVSAIGMFNTMTIALLERINEIGIMRSVGVTRSDVRRLFLMESAIMGFLGGLGGVGLGWLAGELTNFGINLLAKAFGGQSLDLFYQPPWFVAFIIISSTFIGLITGVYPSFKASSLNPLTALRYK